MRFPSFAILCGAAALLLAGENAPAQEQVASSFTVDVPFEANLATPIWLGHPDTPAGPSATLNLPIVPPNSKVSLLVTVFFQEREDGVLSLIWEGKKSSDTLAGDFYEGISMTNQRSLLVSPDTLAGGGVLSLQSSDDSLRVLRVKLEWLENRGALVSPQVADTQVTPESGITAPALTFSGQPAPEPDATWRDHVVSVPITDAPQRIEKGVDFSVEMDTVPGMARLSLLEAGLPWGQHLVVWINQQPAGTITPDVPELGDGGFTAGGKDAPFIGWRPGSIYLPVALLKTGVNALQFSVEDDGAATATPETTAAALAAPLAVKTVVLQLDYPAEVSLAAPLPGAAAGSDDAGASDNLLPTTPAPTLALPPTVTP